MGRCQGRPRTRRHDGVDALVQGRADVTNHAIGAAKVREADAAVGVRYLSLDCTPEGDARARKAVPGYAITTLKAGASTGIVGDTCVLSYDIYWVGHKGLSNEVVPHSLKAVWDNIDKLPPLNPQFQDWTRERAASADVTVPYHPPPCSSTKRRICGTPKWTKPEKIAGAESVGVAKTGVMEYWSVGAVIRTGGRL